MSTIPVQSSAEALDRLTQLMVDYLSMVTMPGPMANTHQTRVCRPENADISAAEWAKMLAAAQSEERDLLWQPQLTSSGFDGYQDEYRSWEQYPAYSERRGEIVVTVSGPDRQKCTLWVKAILDVLTVVNS
jgi:hypothetical protein